MIDERVLQWIRDLDEGGAVSLARSLIHAEVGRLALPITNFSMSGKVKASDAGIDGRTHFPVGCGTLLPEGPQVWQVKSGRKSPSVATEFAQKRGELRQAIREGHDYVLFWTNDPSDSSARTVKRGFERAIQDIRSDAKVSFLFADSIRGLCCAHLAVMASSTGFPFGGVLSLRKWGNQQGFDVRFQEDALRTQYSTNIRDHAASEEAGSNALHVFGDTGVGKSRLVYEALANKGVEERVLVVPEAALLDPALLTFVAEYDSSRLILVVDECEPEQRQKIGRLASYSGGRVRLITIGSRFTREAQATDTRYLELGPLTVSASRQIALNIGISEADADLVAHYTEGYPKLAFELANAIAHGDAGAGLLLRIQSESVGSVLVSMLKDVDDANLLGALSLFDRLGFDGDLAIETKLACAALGLDEKAFRHAVNRELNRFVSQAGRYRLVTPRLLAVWLGGQFIRTQPQISGSKPPARS